MTSTQTWYQKPLDGCVSSTGKPYQILLKKGTVNKLLVNFLGGGASWNEETAARPFTIGRMLKKQEAFYISDVSSTQLRFANVGLFKASDQRNPFRDWYMLNLPYVSGDFHIGNNDFPYQSLTAESKILYHHGQANAAAAIATLTEFFPQTPETLVIMGLSAGGHGCVAHAPQIQNVYPDCEHVIVYSEGSHLHTPLWPEIAENIWNVRPDLMAYIKGETLIADLLRYAQNNMPPSTLFLQSNSLRDKALVEMMYKMNHGKQQVNPNALSEFHTTLLETVGTLKREIPNYYYYLTDYGKSKKDNTTPHTFSGTPKLLYSEMQDGISIANWLCQAVEGNPLDVGAKFVV
ncbi:MAG: pectin acetylesterase-family hydrolase [Oscillospiraceae bacterium]|nr:pectin acetylesterase-family hydrolase [Oscillospiraceae bacterium]